MGPLGEEEHAGGRIGEGLILIVTPFFDDGEAGKLEQETPFIGENDADSASFPI